MTEEDVQLFKPGEYLRLEALLLANIRRQAPELGLLWDRVNRHFGYEDTVYRFYHQSFKIFGRQEDTLEIVATLTAIAPEGRTFCRAFNEIIQAGTGRTFAMEDNQHWVERTAPILQAFLHARYFLEMAVKYAGELAEPPKVMPSGWAALLCLYRLR